MTDTDDIDPFEDDEKPRPDAWDDDEEKPTDSNDREYNPYAGSQSPTDGRCNALLTNYDERYGEKRYCSRLPEHKFVDEGSERCKTHKSRTALAEQAQKLFKHGAFAKNYTILFQRLKPWEQIEAVQTFRDLIEDSKYDFEEEMVDWSFDVSETSAPFAEFEAKIPMPQTKKWAAKPLWTAALDFSKQDRMNAIQFKDGMEKTFVVGVNDNDEPIESTDEHHLHISASRLTGDIKKKLELGGVGVDEDELASSGGGNEFVQVIQSPEDLTAPEAKVSEDSLPLNEEEAFEADD